MAQCDWCKKDMSSDETTSCFRENATIVFPDGKVLNPIPYRGEDRCHDCNVGDWGFHHPGCDAEECPRCHGQIISCGCLSTDDDDDRDELVLQMLKFIGLLACEVRSESQEAKNAYMELQELAADEFEEVNILPFWWDREADHEL